MDIISMETICVGNSCMELMYGNFVRKLSKIPLCLSLCRKILIKVFLAGLSPVLKVDLFWFWFG